MFENALEISSSVLGELKIVAYTVGYYFLVVVKLQILRHFLKDGWQSSLRNKRSQISKARQRHVGT